MGAWVRLGDGDKERYYRCTVDVQSLALVDGVNVRVRAGGLSDEARRGERRWWEKLRYEPPS